MTKSTILFGNIIPQAIWKNKGLYPNPHLLRDTGNYCACGRNAPFSQNSSQPPTVFRSWSLVSHTNVRCHWGLGISTHFQLLSWMEKFRLFIQYGDYIWKHWLMKALTMKVQFTWERVFSAVLVKDWDFGGMASDPLKVQALKSCCECLKLKRKNREMNFQKTMCGCWVFWEGFFCGFFWWGFFVEFFLVF